MHLFNSLMLTLSLLFSIQGFSSAACECEQLACNPCEVQQGMDFYTQSCEQGGEMKSCARPICVAMDPAPNNCVVKVETKTDRQVASVAVVEDIGQEANVEVGTIAKVSGAAWVVSGFGQKKSVVTGMKIYKSDTLKTSLKAKLTLKFKDKNEIHLSEQTTLKVAEYEFQKKANRRKALLELIKGRVRSKVRNKYKGNKASHFRVKTKSAVAGVRGTDFVVELRNGPKIVTKVTTLTGRVKLFDGQNRMEQVNVPAGHMASHVVDKKVFDKNEMREFVKQGYLTPVYKLSRSDLKAMHDKMSFSQASEHLQKSVTVAKNDESVCESPRGDFNQCSWSCLNNPRGEKDCRVDMPQVRCVKKRCNANGEWVEETRVPASSSHQCQPYGHKLNSCDY